MARWRSVDQVEAAKQALLAADHVIEWYQLGFNSSDPSMKRALDKYHEAKSLCAPG